MPLVERPLHLGFALVILLLIRPLRPSRRFRFFGAFIDAALALGILSSVAYLLHDGPRLTERMEGIDDVLLRDRVFGGVLLLSILEGVRRLIGWQLLLVLLGFLVFAFIGQWLPSWTEYPWVPELLRYDGMTFSELVESLTMTANGILGLTTATSVGLVFYFVLFGSVYSAIGGAQLFIDLGLRLSGRQPGGAAKAAVVSSSLMGSISGSAVANVATTGLFTIPLMRKTGYRPAQAAGIEAIASTGGQLMPPIMGVAAFVMAELLQLPYREIVGASLIPALAFYVSLFLVVDLMARRQSINALDSEAIGNRHLLGRLYLLLPPVILVACLLAGWSAPLCAVAGTGACVITAYLRRSSWLSFGDWAQALRQAGQQAASVAIPIAAIGMIIEIAIQSNLALKFSANLIDMSGGQTLAALALIIVGCLMMGMGLPTVAAYIIGSILFVPAMIDLGVPELAAHLFVMYYCVLSMVTPPVALASYTAAGLAQTNAFRCSLQAFRLSWVAFLIPLAFVFEPALLGQGRWLAIAAAALALAIAVTAWAAALVGYWGRTLNLGWRIVLGFGALLSFAIPALQTSPWVATIYSAAKGHWFVWAAQSALLIAGLGWLTVSSRGASPPAELSPGSPDQNP